MLARRPLYPMPAPARLGDLDWFSSGDDDIGAWNSIPTSTSGTDLPTTPVYTTGPSSSWSLDSIFGDVSKLATTAGSIYQQKQLIDINAQRAKNGLPPISASAIAPQVNVGLSSDTTRLIMYGGIGLVALMLLSKKR